MEAMAMKAPEGVFRDYPDVVSVDELCRMLNISTATAYRLLKEQKIDSLRIGHVYKIPKLYVMKYLHLVS
ncbi:DNA binding domain-containing protein, excisionase family [Butyrivibrio sp. INlla18]|uniref:helix-turn-helix domain-containing protein n=1 Tax=Butyrivibrio sp. INlla18 TaxID=1520806 RepID=UPI000890C142|nr:helix-turn-helix domain-containing protein [Butyrivibrio sp. INlla18]SDA79254.1 DNA binding domain-containing protein, excisionase family [Butyrivibrio sp. INlla18]